MVAALLWVPPSADAQPPTARIGVLMPASSPLSKALLDGLQRLGYVEGKNIVVDWRSSSGTEAALQSIARDLARSKVDVIVAGSTPAARAAMEATSVPVVFVVGDPVGAGLAANLARPGGNGTGLSVLTPELTAKRLELLRLAVPWAQRILFMMNSANPNGALQLQEAREAARALELELLILDIYPAGIDASLSKIARSQADGILVAGEILFLENRARIARAVFNTKIPAIFPATEYHDAQVLMSYGPNLTQINRRLAAYVDKILKGAKPAELPIEQLSKFEFVIDLRVARAMGFRIPQELLLRADDVIR